MCRHSMGWAFRLDARAASVFKWKFKMDMNHRAVVVPVSGDPAPFVGFSFAPSCCLVTTFYENLFFKGVYKPHVSSPWYYCLHELMALAWNARNYSRLTSCICFLEEGQNMGGGTVSPVQPQLSFGTTKTVVLNCHYFRALVLMVVQGGSEFSLLCK